MKVAIIGSRGITVDNINEYLPKCSEIISGGAKGVDACAEIFAQRNKIKLTLFKPEYNLFGRAAPIVRNKKIVEYSDYIIAFWDGESRGTRSVIKYAKKCNKPCKVIIIKSTARSKKQSLSATVHNPNFSKNK